MKYSTLQSSVRRLGRLLRRAHFLIFDRRRYGQLTIEEVKGKPILVLPGVFNPALFRSGALLAEFLDSDWIPIGSKVLDLGTGTGVLAVVSSSRAAHVVAVDISDQAVRCARINVLLNGLEEKIEVRRGDLFTSLAGERFDVVIFNPPYLRGDALSDLDQAFWSRDVVENFAIKLKEHLKKRGFALVILSTDGPLADYLETFAICGLGCEKLLEKDLISEVLVIFKLIPRRNSIT